MSYAAKFLVGVTRKIESEASRFTDDELVDWQWTFAVQLISGEY